MMIGIKDDLASQLRSTVAAAKLRAKNALQKAIKYFLETFLFQI
jgi:hypothetical protein